MIDHVNTNKRVHVMTIEDPIEYVHQDKISIINQREQATDTHSFSDALRHVMRQNPDIVLVGEMRDLETIQLAITAAETGHLVLSTLHTVDAAQTIDRIVDVFASHLPFARLSETARPISSIWIFRRAAISVCKPLMAIC
jgi:twitching motility protein PilT